MNITGRTYARRATVPHHSELKQFITSPKIHHFTKHNFLKRTRKYSPYWSYWPYWRYWLCWPKWPYWPSDRIDRTDRIGKYWRDVKVLTEPTEFDRTNGNILTSTEFRGLAWNSRFRLFNKELGNAMLSIILTFFSIELVCWLLGHIDKQTQCMSSV